MKRESTRKHGVSVVLLLCVFAIHSQSVYAQPLKIHTIHVHGDAHILQAPGGKTMLMDAGSPWHVENVKNFIDSLGITQIDVVYLTHFHGDHFGGLVGEEGILASYKVTEFFGVAAEGSMEIFQKYLLPYSKNPDLKYQQIKRGDRIDLDPDIEIRVLYPPDPYPEVGVNNGSAACMITDMRNGRKFLYMGDGMERQARDLVDLFSTDLKCDVLKFGHHLQYESEDDYSLGTFLDVTQPKYGIITKHKMSKPGPMHHQLTTQSLQKLYEHTWNKETGLKSCYLAKHGHISVTCTAAGEIILSVSKNNLDIPPEIAAAEAYETKNGPVTLTLTLSEPTWDHYIEEIRGCYSTDAGVTWNEFFYPENILEIDSTTTVWYKARDIYGNCSETKSVQIMIPKSLPN